MPPSPSRGRDAVLGRLRLARLRSITCALVTLALSVAASAADSAESVAALVLLPVCLLGLVLTLAYMHRVGRHQTTLERMRREARAERRRAHARHRVVTP